MAQLRAERIEYDDRTERVTLYQKALVKRFENDALRDELSGTRIVYDARKANYDVDGRDVDGSASRVHIRIAPRGSAAPAAPAVPPAVKPDAAPALQTERAPPELKR